MGRALIHQPWKTSAQVEFLAASGNGSVSIGFGEGHDFKGCGKNSPLHLILGGAALQRCGKSFALNPASAAEVMPAAFVAVLPQPLQSCRNCFVIVAASAAGGIASFKLCHDPGAATVVSAFHRCYYRPASTNSQ
jgi:hypothetical protein